MQRDQGITFQLTFPMECDQVTRCNQKFPNGIRPVISGAPGKEQGREWGAVQLRVALYRPSPVDVRSFSRFGFFLSLGHVFVDGQTLCALFSLARKRRTDFRTRPWPLCCCAPLASRSGFWSVGKKLSDFFCNLKGRKATKIPCCFKKSLFHSTFLSIACVGRMWLLYFRVVAFLFAFCYGERVRF
jgi:hypothetical protein